MLLQELLLGSVSYLEAKWKHALRLKVSFVIRGSVLDFVRELLLPDVLQVFYRRGGLIEVNEAFEIVHYFQRKLVGVC